MNLLRDDWVKTREGKVGKVVHISKITVFVAFSVPGDEDRVDAFLESQLTKIERPVREVVGAVDRDSYYSAKKRSPPHTRCVPPPDTRLAACGTRALPRDCRILAN